MESVFNTYMEKTEGKAFASKYKYAKPVEHVDCIVCGSKSRTLWYTMGEFGSWRCLKCETRYVSPRYNDSQLDAHYSEDLFTKSKDYEGVAHNMLDPDERARKRMDMKEEIEAVLETIPHGGRVLDIGCQTGIFLEALPESYEKFGVERSKWAAEYCQAITGAKVTKGKVENVDFPAAYFDLINMSYVVEHLQYPLETMQKIVSWLKPKGRLVISVPNFSSFCAVVFKEFYRLADPRQHIYLTTVKSLQKLLTRIGCTIEKKYLPYWGTAYCNKKQLRRLVANCMRRIALPFMLRRRCVPKLENVISPPFWGNIMTLVAKKK